MFRRPISLVALLGLIFIFPAQARAADEKAAKNGKPAVVLRFASLDHLRGDLRYLAKVVGEEEKAKQLDGIIQAKLGDKGLEGIDTKKPIGVYGWVGSFGIDSQVVLLIPIADKQAFLDVISNTLDVKPSKGDDDVYTLSLDVVPAPIYFRFANHYAYVTVRDKEVLDKDKLLSPTAVLPAGHIGGASVTLNIDRIPDGLKENALGVIENQLASIKEKEMPEQTAAQKKFHAAAVNEIGGQIKSLFKHGGETSIRLDLNRKAGDLSLTASVAGKPGSPLANTIRELGQIKSVTASLLQPNSALKGQLNVSLPAKLQTVLSPALKDARKQILAKAENDNQREVIKTILEGIMPTLKAAELDAAIDLQGPSKKGIYTLVGGIKIKEGAKLEKSFRKTAAREPKLIRVDEALAEGINIHRIQPDKFDPGARRTLGKNPVYVAIREDVLLIGAGEDGLDALKKALTAAPTTGKVMELQLSLARLAPLAENQSEAEIARKVFADDKDNDRVHLTLEGGDALTLRLSIKAKIIDFVNQVDKAKKQ